MLFKSKFYDHAKIFWKFEAALVHVACMSEKHKINSFENLFQKFSKTIFLKIKRMNYSIKNFLASSMSDQSWLSESHLKKKFQTPEKIGKKKFSPKISPGVPQDPTTISIGQQITFRGFSPIFVKLLNFAIPQFSIGQI